MADPAQQACAGCGQTYPADALVLTLGGRVCSACEADANADRGQFRKDAWRIAMGPFVVSIGTVTGGMFAFAFGPMVAPIFFALFALIGVGCAWQAGSWGVMELWDRERGRPAWGGVAVIAALGTLGWSLLLVLAGAAIFLSWATTSHAPAIAG